MRGITVAVGEWYAATLAICLPRNMRHLASCLVVTTPRDEAVKEVVRSVPGAELFETDAFHEHSAMFNKGYALEQGFDVLGRHGWICLFDADILLPDDFDLSKLRPDCLNGARRRILEDPSKWTPEIDWRTIPVRRDGAPIGFLQCWDGNNPIIRDKRPWYDVSFTHAGGGDGAFLELWPPSHRHIMPVDVLHLGQTDMNWFGVSPEARDVMAAFCIRNGWQKAAAKHDQTANERVGEITERVDVPGYGISKYEMPFVRRAKQRPS